MSGSLLDALLDAPLDGDVIVADVPNAPYEYVVNHLTDASGDLIEILRKAITSTLLEESVRPLQDTETAIWELLARLTDIDGAGGVHLDRIGVLLDIARRDGWDDAAYRVRLRARILELTSDGRVEQLVAIALAILGVVGAGQVEIREHLGPASMTAYVEKTLDATDSDDIGRSMGVSKAAGVRMHVVYAQSSGWMVTGDATGAVTGGTAGDASVDAMSQPVGVGTLSEVIVARP